MTLKKLKKRRYCSLKVGSFNTGFTSILLACFVGQVYGEEESPMDLEAMMNQKTNYEQRANVIRNQLEGIDRDKVDTFLADQRLIVLKNEILSLNAKITIELKITITPNYVRPLGIVESGFNYSNPTWTIDGNYLGFERHNERSKEIIIADSEGNEVQTVKYTAPKGDDLGLDFLLNEFGGDVSYNAGLSWAPDGSQFVFMSNGAESNYDLFLGDFGANKSTRITTHDEKDGHAHWSPTGENIAFVSSRSGNANVFLYDTTSKNITQISDHPQSFLYPQWSPHGDRFAVIRGSNENHDILVYENLTEKTSDITHRVLVSWDYDDIRPIWSPDGSKIAFYTNYNEQNDPKIWSIAVIDADEKEISDPEILIEKIIATNVIPDADKGPAWMPDSVNIVYVENNRKRYNPIHLVNANTKERKRILTKTKINHDVSCSSDGLIAFRAQIDQWDQIFIAKIPTADKTIDKFMANQ